MKRSIPQFELAFSDEPFALVTEEQAPPVAGPMILAEMTTEEREKVREQSRHSDPHKLYVRSLHDAMASCSCGRWNYRAAGAVSRNHIEAEHRNHKAQFAESETESTPGLASGSYWSSPMAKALSTMQGGR